MAEIAKAIPQNAKIIIMDEPASAITDAEVDRLFRLVEGLSRESECEDISFEPHRGEILGFAGLLGAWGRTELVRSLFGLAQPAPGAIFLGGKPARFKNPKSAIEHGIAYATEDRKGEGACLAHERKPQHNACRP